LLLWGGKAQEGEAIQRSEKEKLVPYSEKGTEKAGRKPLTDLENVQEGKWITTYIRSGQGNEAVFLQERFGDSGERDLSWKKDTEGVKGATISKLKGQEGAGSGRDLSNVTKRRGWGDSSSLQGGGKGKKSSGGRKIGRGSGQKTTRGKGEC